MHGTMNIKFTYTMSQSQHNSLFIYNNYNRVCFQKHLRDFKYRNGKSRFAQHLIDNGHTVGQMEDIMNSPDIIGFYCM